jgi:hypothetical protein
MANDQEFLIFDQILLPTIGVYPGDKVTDPDAISVCITDLYVRILKLEDENKLLKEAIACLNEKNND